MSVLQSYDYPIPSQTSAFSRLQPSSYESQSSDGQPVSDLAHHATIQAIRKLLSFRDNWDRHGSPAPRRESVNSALDVVKVFRDSVVRSDGSWTRPHVSANEEGNVVFEWWRGERKLTIYVRSAHVAYIKVWGVDIDTEMEDGRVTDAGFGSLWTWLNG